VRGADPFDVIFLDGAPSGWIDRSNWDHALSFLGSNGVIRVDLAILLLGLGRNLESHLVHRERLATSVAA
jgi:hypothetical protein